MGLFASVRAARQKRAERRQARDRYLAALDDFIDTAEDYADLLGTTYGEAAHLMVTAFDDALADLEAPTTGAV